MNLILKNTFGFAKVSFIGLGNMGFPMAINLAKKGHQVFAYDVDAKKEQQARNNNITFRKQIKQLSSDADIFVAMLPNSEHSKAVCLESNGIFQNAPKGSLILDCSTIAPMVAIELNQQAKSRGMTYVDAPVSGGVTGAQAGTLTFMVGAENEQLFNRSKQILEAMGKSFFNCQKPGAGQIAKLCNNMALGIEMIGISEALAMGAKLGMDGKVLSDIMKVSSSRCWSVDTYNPVPGVIEGVPSSREYERGFGSELMLKDLKLAIEAAQSANCKVELGQTSKKIYQKIVDQGMGRKDFGIIYDLILKNKA